MGIQDFNASASDCQYSVNLGNTSQVRPDKKQHVLHRPEFRLSNNISLSKHDEIKTFFLEPGGETTVVTPSLFFQQLLHRIAVMYELGIHVRKDLHKALQWHLRSAKFGYVSAQCDVGIFFEDGHAGAQDIDTALFWYVKAAAQGDPFAVEALYRLRRLKHLPGQ